MITECIAHRKIYYSRRTLNEMTYLDLVCKESLRLYPSVPIFGRTVPEEMTVCMCPFKGGFLDCILPLNINWKSIEFQNKCKKLAFKYI